MFDVIILGGTIVDGTGSPGYRADIGINNDRITAISDLSKSVGSRVINAVGKTITPGFIDTHVHSDSALLSNPKHPEGILQGITTEILGQDGLSYCPLSPENYKIYGRYLKGILGDPPANLDPSSVSSFRKAYDGTTAVNTAYLIAHGALRLETCGFDDIPMIDDRLKHARRLVEEGMEQGAVGLATGIAYKEIVEIGKDRLFAMVDTIKEDDVKSLGTDHLSSMMSGIEGTQISELTEEKKVSIVDNLQANFFGSNKAEFKGIEDTSTDESRPTISEEKVGQTKITGAEKTGGFFGRKGLFSKAEA